tara:strand:+ start:125 stop:1093 length:969 start_codon:yes stop_codon:yes gene_type:complete
MSYRNNHGVPLVSDLETNKEWLTFTFADMKSPQFRLPAVSGNGNTTEYLIPYIKEVSKGLRHAYKFAVKNKDYEKRYYVYDLNDLFPLGWIGYGDFSVSTEGQLKYVVYATNVSNNKYDDYRQQHHMRMSENFSTAVRNAKKHLLPIPHIDVARRTLDETRDKLGDFINSTRQQLRTNLDKLGVNSNIANCKRSQVWLELCHKLDVEQQFLSSEFKDILVKARSLLKVIEERESVPINMYCVRVYERLGQQTFDVILIPNLPSAYNLNLSIDNEYGSRRYNSAETLPPEIMSKVSVLAICNVGDFIEDVGHRNMETLYYVYA